MARQRLDTLLLERGLCPSRQKAQSLIRAGEVKVNQQVIDKPGTEVDTAAQIQLEKKPPYVSRGGEKLAAALTTFKIRVKERICLDGGISTGGFTDCLLQAGARQVYGVDVGYGQVAWRLRGDSRVTLRERTNFRYLTPEELYGEAPLADLAVMDLSFISLTKVLPTLWNLLVPPREAVLVVKPQFEVGRERVGKKGVVRQAADRARATFQVMEAAQQLGWHYGGLVPSPLKGPAGNVEYLLWLTMEGEAEFPTLEAVEEIVQTTAGDNSNRNFHDEN